MHTAFLIMWMSINGQPMLTVQAVDANTCEAMRTGRSACVTNEAAIDRIIEAGGCKAFEVREDFVNFTCERK